MGCAQLRCRMALVLRDAALTRPKNETWQRAATEAAKLAREARAEEDTDGKA